MSREFGHGPGEEEMNKNKSWFNFNKAAAVLGGLAIGSGIGEGSKAGVEYLTNQEAKEYVEILRQGTASVLEKKHTPESTESVWVGAAKMAVSVPVHEKWTLKLLFKDSLSGKLNRTYTNDLDDLNESDVDVTKEQYDSSGIGDNIPVSYRLSGQGEIRDRDNIKIIDGK